ncbi:hypothetical protein M409DRAFT_71558 [Zasmidium cellare ATCC 36951]|uniref:Uncharacterized protein n=1 Tax=Zasmidium cellare ATCC 36951 TaxID=1080233 RepID=A0A6A6BX57_ZASCE|nr:uncharacterized protein M409DRAFT_71558 [Zasmidium cellare ATCC 36951]KAF2158618.1 hypothetical protein M409DRAFT_71558 [Zasmidium cellare ATCC 36951]
MAPNPIMIPRKPVPRRSEHHKPRRSSASYWQEPLLGGAILVLLAAAFPLARIWLLSGAGIESSLILWGSRTGSRVFSSIPLWTVLATLNLIYAICSTSWLLHGIFATLCWISVGLTSLFQFPTAAHYARRALRKALGKHPHFIKDKIALFNLPALEIDTEVDGLMVMRGVTISLSSLTLVVHGIELGLKLADDIELAIYVDEVTVRLFRRIEVGDVYANVKGGQFEMTFSGLDDPADDAASVESVFLDDTPLLRAATLGSEGFQDRPKLRETLTGVSYVRDSSARAGFDSVQSFSPDDEIADRQYHDRLTEIRTSSAVYQSRQQVRHKAKSGSGFTVDDEQDMRAAVSAELHGLPSVPHPPSRSVRVTTLQRLSPPYMRRFMHRLPFLLRLLLAPLSYFHPINISSINAAGSGQWVSQLLQQQVFKEYAETNLQLRKLHRRISHWLADANFCLQLADIHGLGQVPLSTSFDIVAYLKFNDVMAYRTEPQSSTIRQVVRLGGADATFTIPSFLLPHHEHIVPPQPTAEDEEELEVEIEESTSLPKAVQTEREFKRTKKDETEITMSVHASLPASCDQSLLNFIAALVKATKIIELEKEVDEVDTASPSSDEPATPTSPTFDNIDSISIASNDSTSTDFRTRSPSKPALPLNSVKDIASFKLLAKNIRQNLKDGTTSNSIKEFARDLHQQTKDGMKKAMVGGLVNDRWIAKLVGKTAAMLQKAQGDVGYSGSIPIALGPYRSESTGEWGTKILP